MLDTGSHVQSNNSAWPQAFAHEDAWGPTTAQGNLEKGTSIYICRFERSFWKAQPN